MTRARQSIAAFVLGLAWIGLGSTSVMADTVKRYALVIGNSDYRAVEEVPNAARDAAHIAQSLSDLNFQVISGFDVDRLSLERLVTRFGQQAANAGAETVVIYYAGHGVQFDGLNHLVPVDAALQDLSRQELETFVLDDILASVQNPLRQTIAFVDACRGNPLNGTPALGDGSQGLAQIDARDGTFIAFAAQPGDAGCTNSAFTDALLTHIGRPDLSLTDMMTKVGDDVATRTLGRQVPWVQSSLQSEFHFNPSQPFLVASSQSDVFPVASGETHQTAGDPAKKAGTAEPGLVIGAATEAETASATPGVSPILRRLQPTNARLASVDGRDMADSEATSTPSEPQAAPEQPMASQENELALALPPAPRSKPEVPAKQDDLARPIQEKLKKIGCYKGGIDGQWGPLSRRAVKRYYDSKGRSARSLEPAVDLLSSLKKESKTVCATPKTPTATAKKKRAPAKARPVQQADRQPQPQHWEPARPPIAPGFVFQPHGGMGLSFGF